MVLPLIAVNAINIPYYLKQLVLFWKSGEAACVHNSTHNLMAVFIYLVMYFLGNIRKQNNVDWFSLNNK